MKDGRRLGPHGPVHDDAVWDRRHEHLGVVGWCEVGEGAETAWRQAIGFVRPRIAGVGSTALEAAETARRAFLNGTAYVKVHMQRDEAGEIRGQVDVKAG
ncbi:MAG: hypothetical protein FJW96_07310 [Actinobacteria bacterium]|nr:hypothetical protein [Actinomycetota bacterium]